MSPDPYKVAAIQMAPVYLNRQATLAKMCTLIQEAATGGAQLIVLPEVIYAGYPNWVTDLYLRDGGSGNYSWRNLFFDQATETIPGPATEEIGALARELGVHVVFGLNEADTTQAGVIYNTGLLMGPRGDILLRHRKVTPVLHEMFYYRRGAAEDLAVAKTEIGTIGIAICFEHFNPFVRRSLAELGEQIHCGLWVTPPGADHQIQASAQMTAIEAGVFVVTSGQVNPADEQATRQNWDFTGGSYMVDPMGRITARHSGSEEIVWGSIDLRKITTARWRFNGFGRDARPDLFRFSFGDETAT